VAPAAFLVEAPPGSTMGVRGKDFSSLLRASGGLPPIQWRISEGVLPPGLGLNSETGGIAGRPSAVGAFAFAVIASDKAGNQASGRITITVAEPPDTKKPSEDAALADTRRQQKVDPPKEVPEAKKQPPIAPPETAPALPACKASSFVLEQYGDSRAGQLTWSGTLPGGGKLEIQNRRPSNGNLRGDILPKGVPVRVSVVPDTVRITTGPSAVNCWDPQLVLLNAGQAASEITIRWEVFQP